MDSVTIRTKKKGQDDSIRLIIDLANLEVEEQEQIVMEESDDPELLREIRKVKQGKLMTFEEAKEKYLESVSKQK